jgi:glycosyltransferase involved in cell wall biosynthesis
VNVTIVCEGSLPMSTGGGPRMNQWAVADELVMRGHQVHIVNIVHPDNVDIIALYALNQRGIMVTPVSYIGLSPYRMAMIIAEGHPDVIFGLAAWNIAWASSYDSRIPRVCMMGDPEHVIQSYRRQLKNPEPLTYEEIATLHNAAMVTKKTYLDILATCAAVYCPVESYCLWFKNLGFNVEYIPMPIVEPAFPGWRRRTEDMPKNAKPRILMAGHLGGIATLSSLYYLADELLPVMHNIDVYDWRICGGDELQSDLANRFKNYPQIKFTGYVHDIRKEMLQADVFLCTTSIPVGVRTRLVEAMALGCTIVAHASNAIGQPELQNGENILLADNGQEMASLLDMITSHPAKSYAQGLAARETYEQHFRTALSAGRMINKMEELVNARS